MCMSTHIDACAYIRIQTQKNSWRVLILLQLAPQHVKDIPRLLLQIKTVRATPRDWAQLHQSVVSANMLKETTYLLLSNVRAGGLYEESSTSFAGGPRAAALRPAELLGSRTAPGDPLSKDTPYSAASPFLLRQVLEEFSNDLSMLQSMVDEARSCYSAIVVTIYFCICARMLRLYTHSISVAAFPHNMHMCLCRSSTGMRRS